MPTLNAMQLESLQQRPVRTCPTCTRALRWNYCRQHDEYFEAGHMSRHRTGGNELHDSHKTY